MPKRKQEPLPDDIAAMTGDECKAEEDRMRESGEFEHAIQERDRWQALADAWISRKAQLVRRRIELITPEEDK